MTPYHAADLIRRGAVVELAEFLGTLRRSFEINPFALVRNVVWRCGLRPLGGIRRFTGFFPTPMLRDA